MSRRTTSDIPLGRMSTAAFPSPAAEMAEMNRIQYEIEYTEGINQRMRVPEKLKVAPPNADLEQTSNEGGLPNASVTMQVPERIVVAGNNEDIPLSRPPDLDLISSTPFKPLSLKTPPHVISLSERPLDFLDLERAPQTLQNEEIRSVGRLKRERSMSENATRQNGQLMRNESMKTQIYLHGCLSQPNKTYPMRSSQHGLMKAPGSHSKKKSPSQEDSLFSCGPCIATCALIIGNAITTVKEAIVTPSPQQVRVCPPQMFSEDGSNLYSARGILSLIQSSTRRAYQQVLDVLDENRRPVLRGGSAGSTSSNPHHDNSRYTLSSMDTTFEGTPEDMTVVDATSLRRQIIKLNRRLQLLEEENKERTKREMIMYSITVAFWLLNSWLWFRR